MQLRWSTTGQVYLGNIPSSDDPDDSDNSNYPDNSHDPHDANDADNSDYPNNSYDASHDAPHDADNSVRATGPCADSVARNERDTESRHPGRPGSLDDLNELDAH